MKERIFFKIEFEKFLMELAVIEHEWIIIWGEYYKEIVVSWLQSYIHSQKKNLSDKFFFFKFLNDYKSLS